MKWNIFIVNGYFELLCVYLCYVFVEVYVEGVVDGGYMMCVVEVLWLDFLVLCSCFEWEYGVVFEGLVVV